MKFDHILIGATIITLLIAATVVIMTWIITEERPIEVSEVDAVTGLRAITMDASTRTILSNAEGRFCAEPPPDAGANLISTVAASLAAEGPTIDTEAIFSGVNDSNLVALFQRSQGIQGLRDGMYRVCEGFINGAIRQDKYAEQITNLVATMNYLIGMEQCARIATSIPSLSGLDSETVSLAMKSYYDHYRLCADQAELFANTILGTYDQDIN